MAIGKNCKIGPDCYIRPHTCIGDRCHIGASVEVKNSIIMQNTALPHHNYVGDSIIGTNCNLGFVTKIVNLRLDKKEVEVSQMSTGVRKFGGIIGKRVKAGINASINCRSIIGDEVYIGSGAFADGVIESEARLGKSGLIPI